MTGQERLIALALMLRRGWTIPRLLSERGDDLDYIDPTFSPWLRIMDEAFPGLDKDSSGFSEPSRSLH